ncbi:MAG: hypothetical protein OEY35_00905 [Gammaproteobacteria bacterium]|nr:hypothetical protein [Gammaproteobacteria bacterium]
MSDNCKLLEYCPIWEQYNSNLKYIWIKSYCQGNKQSQCKRKQMTDSGENPPLELLPDGTLLPKIHHSTSED